MILLDANVLLRLIQIGHPHQQPAVDSIALLHGRDHEQLAICPQVLYEMYAVCTRPVDAPYPGLGLTPAVAMTQVEAAERHLLEGKPSAVWAIRHEDCGARGSLHRPRQFGANHHPMVRPAFEYRRVPLSGLMAIISGET